MPYTYRVEGERASSTDNLRMFHITQAVDSFQNVTAEKTSEILTIYLGTILDVDDTTHVDVAGRRARVRCGCGRQHDKGKSPDGMAWAHGQFVQRYLDACGLLKLTIWRPFIDPNFKEKAP